MFIKEANQKKTNFFTEDAGLGEQIVLGMALLILTLVLGAA